MARLQFPSELYDDVVVIDVYLRHEHPCGPFPQCWNTGRMPARNEQERSFTRTLMSVPPLIGDDYDVVITLFTTEEFESIG